MLYSDLTLKEKTAILRFYLRVKTRDFNQTYNFNPQTAFDELPLKCQDYLAQNNPFKKEFFDYSPSYIPLRLQTEDNVINAIGDGMQIEGVREDLKTYRVCMHTVCCGDGGWFLDKIPKEHWTDELLYKAVENWGDALEDVPDDKKTKEMCAAAICDCCYTESYILQLIPCRLRDLDMCVKAVTRHENNLKFVPKGLREKVKAKIIQLKRRHEKIRR